jgi:3-demethoxyubiquinol 3-hydroxylase
VKPTDALLIAADSALRTLWGTSHSSRAYPGQGATDSPDDAGTAQLSAALMRVNHVGEVCAQALYTAQALGTRNVEMRDRLRAAAREETDHLAWTQQRLNELGGRTSVLNPLWYAGAFGLGLIAGRSGDAWSLGFVVETERQVERHLDDHLQRLPASDTVSRAIVEQMKQDEVRHAQAAQAAGAAVLPAPLRWGMRLAGRIMTTTAHYL